MTVKIYCIEDINDLKYVGSTTRELRKRLWDHIGDKKRNSTCSSKELNLYNCIIYELESCHQNQRKERERYWIDKIDCVNVIKLNIDPKDSKRIWREKNPNYNKEYKLRLKKKDIILTKDIANG